jgi:hypothetical protein
MEQKEIVLYSIIIFIIIVIIYNIMNKKENLNISDSKDKEFNPINGKEKLKMVPNCNLLNDRDVCLNTKGCTYDDKTLGCYYDWPNV